MLVFPLPLFAQLNNKFASRSIRMIGSKAKAKTPSAKPGKGTKVASSAFEDHPWDNQTGGSPSGRGQTVDDAFDPSADRFIVQRSAYDLDNSRISTSNDKSTGSYSTNPGDKSGFAGVDISSVTAAPTERGTPARRMSAVELADMDSEEEDSDGDEDGGEEEGEQEEEVKKRGVNKTRRMSSEQLAELDSDDYDEDDDEDDEDDEDYEENEAEMEEEEAERNTSSNRSTTHLAELPSGEENDFVSSTKHRVKTLYMNAHSREGFDSDEEQVSTIDVQGKEKSVGAVDDVVDMDDENDEEEVIAGTLSNYGNYHSPEITAASPASPLQGEGASDSEDYNTTDGGETDNGTQFKVRLVATGRLLVIGRAKRRAKRVLRSTEINSHRRHVEIKSRRITPPATSLFPNHFTYFLSQPVLQLALSTATSLQTQLNQAHHQIESLLTKLVASRNNAKQLKQTLAVQMQQSADAINKATSDSKILVAAAHEAAAATQQKLSLEQSSKLSACLAENEKLSMEKEGVRKELVEAKRALSRKASPIAGLGAASPEVEMLKIEMEKTEERIQVMKQREVEREKERQIERDKERQHVLDAERNATKSDSGKEARNASLKKENFELNSTLAELQIDLEESRKEFSELDAGRKSQSSSQQNLIDHLTSQIAKMKVKGEQGEKGLRRQVMMGKKELKERNVELKAAGEKLKKLQQVMGKSRQDCKNAVEQRSTLTSQLRADRNELKGLRVDYAEVRGLGVPSDE